MIGSSLRIKGEVDGAEDLLIEGCVEGTVTLKQNRLTVGRGGRVQADIFAKTIIVEGEVTGDLHGAESVAILKSGIVKGNIKAPRVTLEDGARIKGSIDTDPAQGEFQSVAGVGAPKPAPKPEEPAKPTNANGARAPMQ